MCTETSDPDVLNLDSSDNPNSDVAAITAAVALARLPGAVVLSTHEDVGECGVDTAPLLSSAELILDHSGCSAREPEASAVVGSVLAMWEGTTLEGMRPAGLQTTCANFGKVSGRAWYVDARERGHRSGP